MADRPVCRLLRWEALALVGALERADKARTDAIEPAERLLDLVFHADLPRLPVAVTEEASELRRALTELDETSAQVLPYAHAFIDLIDVAESKEA